MYLARELAADDVSAYLETSRRGGHLWLFLAQAVPGKETRAFGQGLLAVHQVEGVELFPKQDRLSGGPGSLIRTPFGVHSDRLEVWLLYVRWNSFDVVQDRVFRGVNTVTALGMKLIAFPASLL